MTWWHTLKATIVGIHADYHTNFDRLKEKYGNPGDTKSMIICENCGNEYNPVTTHWLCTSCGWKTSCCEGEPCPTRD